MEPKKTVLYDRHVALGAKMVEFAGYLMPVQYSGIIEEHKAVRDSAGLFDVSHMGEFRVQGQNALDFLQKVTINDVSKIQVSQAQYTAMCYPDGGVVDDLIVYRKPDHYLMIVNAGNLKKNWEWLQENMQSGVECFDESDETSLFALQGRSAENVLQALTKTNLSTIKFYWFAQGEIAGSPAMIARTGYTGEAGFEIAVPNNHATAVWDALLQAGQKYNVVPVGLGARDTLRLEMKYCLYGNEIDATTNPLEAGLGWITKLDKGEFNGSDAIRRLKEQKAGRKLIGMELPGRNIARHGYEIVIDGVKVGQITSGTFSPSLEKSIAVGYIESAYAQVGTEVKIKIRQREVAATIVKTPFYSRPY